MIIETVHCFEQHGKKPSRCFLHPLRHGVIIGWLNFNDAKSGIMHSSLREKYSKILKVSPKASKSEIKKAFREQSKKIHPDKNPSENAHAQFVELNQAYAYLMNPENWEEKKDKVYKQAHYYSNASWQKFEESAIYKSAGIIAFVLPFIYTVTGILMVIGPIVGIINYVIEGNQNPDSFKTQKIIEMSIASLFVAGIGVALILIFGRKARKGETI